MKRSRDGCNEKRRRRRKMFVAWWIFVFTLCDVRVHNFFFDLFERWNFCEKKTTNKYYSHIIMRCLNECKLPFTRTLHRILCCIFKSIVLYPIFINHLDPQNSTFSSPFLSPLQFNTMKNQKRHTKMHLHAKIPLIQNKWNDSFILRTAQPAFRWTLAIFQGIPKPAHSRR